jgi:HAD superfamily hydrolase (TIGR01549 family)
MIEWIFFDVGNIIFDDAPVMALIYDALYERARRSHPDLTFERLLAERERLIREQHGRWPHHDLAEKYLGENGYREWRDHYNREVNRDYDRYNIPVPGIHDVLRKLGRRYKLGLAANQPLGCRASMERRGFLQYFSLVWLSAEVGMEKPEPEFFATMLAKAGCRPEAAVMIGDRMDNDIRPARKAGMKTVWLRYNCNVGELSAEKETWRSYFESRRRVSSADMAPRGDDERPDATVSSVGEIPGAVARL